MTINQALEEARKVINADLLPKRSTLYGWIKAGAISEPLAGKRQNKGRGGGARDIFPAVLPFEIAVTACLQKVWKLPIAVIAEGRRLAESIRNGTFQGRYMDWNTPRRPLTPAENIRDLWFLYLAKAKAGLRIDEPAEVIITVKYKFRDGKYSIEESVKKAQEEKVQLRYEEDRT